AIDAAYRVIARVGDEYRIVSGDESLRMIERRGIRCPVLESGRSAAEAAHIVARIVEQHDLVVAGIGQHPLRCRPGRSLDLSGKQEASFRLVLQLQRKLRG